MIAHAQACRVHHHKHALHAFVGLAHHGAVGIVQNDLCSGIAVNAHFVFQAAAVNAIALANRAIRIDAEFGHDEQTHALDARRRIGQACQHQMDDVVGDIVFTRADKNFVAGDAVAAIGLGFGLGAHQAQIGTAMRLGQAHGARPFATGHFVQIGFLLFVSAMRRQSCVGTVRQAWVHGPSLVG